MKLVANLLAGALTLALAGPAQAQGFPDLGKLGGFMSKAKGRAQEVRLFEPRRKLS